MVTIVTHILNNITIFPAALAASYVKYYHNKLIILPVILLVSVPSVWN